MYPAAKEQREVMAMARQKLSARIVAAALLAATALSPAWANTPTPGIPTGPTAPAGAPNVIVIMTDDVGFASSSTFGGEIPTPVMDRLAGNGLRYSNFHTTALCSPSRAALLTGRNHHAVGFGTVSDLAHGDPGYTSIIPKSAATIAQVLRSNGYSTAAFGKHHNVPMWQAGPLGPFDQWMSGLGFDYFYGFHGGHANQFAPGLVENNSLIEPPNDPDYIFDRDMTDHAVQWLRTQKLQGGGKPFFLYYAPGTAHAPLQAPAEWLLRFRGKFDDGYDALRQRIFVRQKKLGVIPRDAKLAALPPEVKPWATLTPDQKRVSARYMEAYAAALAYSDAQVGRMLDTLRLSGQLDNTLIVYIQGDNGSTPEGGPDGLFNYAGRFGNADSASADLARIDDIGGPRSYSVAPVGWMSAMNTPFPYYKTVASRLGGITNGMVVSWPDKIKARGVRPQFTHLVDLMPTILEASGIQAPASFNGVAQQPIDGVSFGYSFASGKVPAQHHKQYFEMFGNTALYKDGWLLASPTTAFGPAGSTKPQFGTVWELYDLNRDPSQTHDVAALHPDKVKELRADFDAEAARNHVLPMSRDGLRQLLPENRPEEGFEPGRYTYYPSTLRYPRAVFPSINNRSWSIEADLDVPASGGDGVIVTQGGRFSGWGLVMLQGVPTFLYRSSDTAASLTRVAAPGRLAPGRHKVDVRFTVAGKGFGKGGALAMKVDGAQVATGQLTQSVPINFTEPDAAVGRDNGTPVTDDYRVPFAISGLRSVTFDLGPLQRPRADDKPN
jgi:arylsulfatase